MLDIGSLNFPLPPRSILQQITKNLKLCTHVCIRLWNIQFHCTFHRVQSARSINSKSLLLSLSFSFSLNGERISLTESGCSRFLRKARDRKMRGIVSSSLWNYWPRFDGRRKRRASKDARLIFLQTNTEFFQESCLHRRQPYLEAGFEQWFTVSFDFSLFKSLSFILV